MSSPLVQCPSEPFCAVLCRDVVVGAAHVDPHVPQKGNSAWWPRGGCVSAVWEKPENVNVLVWKDEIDTRSHTHTRTHKKWIITTLGDSVVPLLRFQPEIKC